MLRIVSGGQTGVDRGALDAALDIGVGCGGWCPVGRLAEDGMIPERYPVIELSDGGYAERTAQNVADSDGTLIISNGGPIGGTRETAEHCVEMRKPYLIIDYKLVPVNQAVDLAFGFVSQLSSRPIATELEHVTPQLAPRDRSPLAGMTIILNVAGPRASQWPEAHTVAHQIVSGMLRRISGQNDAN